MTASAVRVKQFTFPLAVEWVRGRRVVALVDGKNGVEVAPPVVFHGTDPHAWSPEDLFVAAVASCLAVTFTGLAERAALDLTSLRVDCEGIAGARADGHFGFTEVRLAMHVVVARSDRSTAERLAAEAEAKCLISASMALPVTVTVDVS